MPSDGLDGGYSPSTQAPPDQPLVRIFQLPSGEKFAVEGELTPEQMRLFEMLGGVEVKAPQSPGAQPVDKLPISSQELGATFAQFDQFNSSVDQATAVDAGRTNQDLELARQAFGLQDYSADFQRALTDRQQGYGDVRSFAGQEQFRRMVRQNEFDQAARGRDLSLLSTEIGAQRSLDDLLVAAAEKKQAAVASLLDVGLTDSQLAKIIKGS